MEKNMILMLKSEEWRKEVMDHVKERVRNFRVFESNNKRDQAKSEIKGKSE